MVSATLLPFWQKAVTEEEEGGQIKFFKLFDNSGELRSLLYSGPEKVLLLHTLTQNLPNQKLSATVKLVKGG